MDTCLPTGREYQISALRVAGSPPAGRAENPAVVTLNRNILGN